MENAIHTTSIVDNVTIIVVVDIFIGYIYNSLNESSQFICFR